MIDQLLSELRRREIRIWADGGRLRYDASRGSLDDEFLALLRTHREAILERVHAANRSASAPPPTRAERGPAVLSFAQERMWLLWKLRPHSAAYTIAFSIRFLGALDAVALLGALREIRQRHAVLRTRIRESGGGLTPEVDDSTILDLPLLDVVDAADAEAAMRLQAATPFDLSREAPFAVRLYRAAADRHWLFVKLHHIAADVASISIFLHELALLYGGGSPGELPLQYGDLAAWQREHLQGPARAALLAYWRRRLEGDVAPLRLPTDHPRTAAEGARGGRVAFEIPPRLSARLAELRGAHRVTSFMLLLAAFRVLLYRYTNQVDFLIGTPALSRNRRGAEGLIGFFGNTLLLRNPLSADDLYADVLARERTAALEAYEHQELPYEILTDELGRERTLIQAMFSFAEGGGDAEWPPELAVEVAEVETATAKFDLLLAMRDTGEGWGGVFEYREDLFERETIERMAGHFEVLLADLAERPNGNIAEVSLLTERERARLRAWNDTSAELPQTRCVHASFEAQAAAHPDGAAIHYGHDVTSYAVLNEQANGIAYRLLAQGVGRGELVAVCMRRTPRLVAALLGILKTGAAYVPIDPRYPAERIRRIAGEARARHLLTDGELAPLLPPTDADTIVLDAVGIDGSPRNPGIGVDGNDLAYVLFTSGSTGAPKGVMIEHRSATALLEWARRLYTGEDLAVVLAASSVCFDLSVFELFAPLCAGGSIALADDMLALPSLPARGRITLINTVPSVMRVLLASHADAFPETLRVVNLAGERLETRLADEVYRRTRARRVFDLYGPTESTTYATFKLRLPGERAAIGRPIANTRCYVVDPRGVPVPIGVVGELLLAGEGLARGYLHRPDLTEEMFATPSCPLIAEARVYRTSDQVRFNAGGDLEYVGRHGDQLKVRGFRVEPAEVRAALLTADGIDDAWVVGREVEDGTTALVAYVVGDAQRASGAMLRRHLRAILPESMIPTSFARVDAIPLTPNGKLDMARLRTLAADRESEPAAPRTALEAELLAIWRDVLGDGAASAAADFFDLGGHSLTAMRIAARVRDAFGVDLPLQAVFEHPTVVELALHIDALRNGAAASLLPPVVPRGRTDAPVTLLQRHFWLMHHVVADSSFLNIARAVDFKGAFDVDAATRAWTILGERHPILRAHFVFSGRMLWQMTASGAPLDQSVEDLRGIGDEAARRRELAAIYAHACRPFDLTEGPCARFVIVRMADDHHVVIFVLHHIVTDEWSLEVLQRELGAEYAAAAAGVSTVPVPRSATFADYAAWEHDCRAAKQFDAQYARWKEALRAPLPRLRLRWRDDEAHEPAEIETYAVGIDARLSAKLAELARRERVSLFVVLLSALKRLLARESGATDVRVITNLASRGRQGMEAVVGPLTDTLVLRTELPADDEPLSALRRVRDSFVAACSRRDIPFEELASRLRDEEGIERHELGQVFFLYHGEDAASPAIPGLMVEPAEIETGGDFFKTAVHDYDLILYLLGTAGGIRGQLTLQGQLQNGDVAADLLRTYTMLLEELVDHAIAA